MIIKLKTLTPLWTSGVEKGTMERVHETGIIGSLRWWYEAIVRGLGGDACDPTTTSCIYDSNKANDGLCDVCRLFGATGWRRRFRLQIVAEPLKPAWAPEITLNIRPYGRTGGWYLPAGHVGSFTLALHGDPETLSILMALLRFLEQWGSLGAKPQLGYGLYQIESVSINEEAYTWQTKDARAKISQDPDLRTFSFFKLRFTPRQANWWHEISGIRELMRRRREQAILNQLAKQGMIPLAPALKNHLRFSPRWSSNAIPHEFFGTLRGNQRIRSKISLSWAYRTSEPAEWEIRGWCYLPPTIRLSTQKEIERVLKDTLSQPQGWFKALGIPPTTAQVEFAPTNDFLPPYSVKQIADFLIRGYRKTASALTPALSQ